MIIALCDDNREYINTVEEYFDQIKDISFEYDVFENGEDLVKMYQNNDADYDAILLDMEMKKLDGIETANLIRNIDKQVIIIFVTSHTKYMQKSFECSPFRFLIKPIRKIDLQKVIDEVCIKLKDEPQTFVFTERKTRVRLFCEDILFFENQGHWVLIYTIEKQYKIYKSFFNLYNQLDKKSFCRVHKSFIINFKYIKEIRENNLILYDYEETVPISRTYKKELINGFINSKERKYLI